MTRSRFRRCSKLTEWEACMARVMEHEHRYLFVFCAVTTWLVASQLCLAQDAAQSAPSSSSVSSQSGPQADASPTPPPAQPQSSPQPSPSPNPNATLENTITAGESDDEPPARRLVKWNEYEGPYITARVGGGFLLDFAGYAQDTESKQQVKLSPDYKLRDARFLLRGKF